MTCDSVDRMPESGADSLTTAVRSSGVSTLSMAPSRAASTLPEVASFASPIVKATSDEVKGVPSCQVSSASLKVISRWSSLIVHSVASAPSSLVRPAS